MVLWSPGHQSFPFWSTMRLMATTQTLHLSLSDGKACPPRLLQPGTQQQVFTMKYDCPYSREREGWKTQPIWRTCVAWPATQRHLTATGRIMAAVPKSLIGVKQGCVLSPLLFNMYVSDIPDIFDDACRPVTVISLTTNSMPFADDLVLLSESAECIQRCIGKLENYCHQWGLTINQDKTKVIIINKGGKKLKKIKFYVNDSEIEIVQSYC